MIRKSTYCFLLLAANLALNSQVQFAQTQRSGANFLKLGLGPRQSGFGGSFAGVGDDIYTMYYNPAGMGIIRQWELSANYNRYFADINYGAISGMKQFRFLRSRRNALGLGLFYLGIPEWDSTDGRKAPVSASTFMINFAYGYRVDWLSKDLSIGASGKYFRSSLENLNAAGYALDLGILLRRQLSIKLPQLGWRLPGPLWIGATAQNIGKQNAFIFESSPLPRFYRAGLSYWLAHTEPHHLMMSAGLTYHQHEDSDVSLGLEYWWNNRLSLRGGYRFNGKDIADLSFGFSLRMDPFITPTKLIEGLQIDHANNDFGNALESSWPNFAISLHPVEPEPFQLLEPANDAFLNFSINPKLTWEDSPDPDMFDQVRYIVVIGANQKIVEELVRKCKENPLAYSTRAIVNRKKVAPPISEKNDLAHNGHDRLPSDDLSKNLWDCDYKPFEAECPSGVSSPLLIAGRKAPLLSAIIPTRTDEFLAIADTLVEHEGIYYWAVLAHDREGHVRVADPGVWQFNYIYPNLKITQIDFEPLNWLTDVSDTRQGNLVVTVQNEGLAPVENVLFNLYGKKKAGDGATHSRLHHEIIPRLGSGMSTTIEKMWSASESGEYEILACLDSANIITESNELDNGLGRYVCTIPKGQLVLPDTVRIARYAFDTRPVPIVPMVFFDRHLPYIDETYRLITPDNPIAALSIIAERLRDSTHIVVTLRGYIEKHESEKIELAKSRAEAVATTLTEQLGVSADQVRVYNSHDPAQHRLPIISGRKNPEFAYAENRRVEIDVDSLHQPYLYQPYKLRVLSGELSEEGLAVNYDIQSCVGALTYRLDMIPPSAMEFSELRPPTMNALSYREYTQRKLYSKIVAVKTKEYPIALNHVIDAVGWNGVDKNDNPVQAGTYYYRFFGIEDKCNTWFYARPDSFYLDIGGEVIFDQFMLALNEFESANLAYPLYRSILEKAVDAFANGPEDLRVRIIGHTDTTGYGYFDNDSLSLARARLVHNVFNKILKENYPTKYNSLRSQIDEPVGVGLRQPMKLSTAAGTETLYGDNMTPQGRIVNRRVEIQLLKKNE